MEAAARERGVPIPDSCYPPEVSIRLWRYNQAFWELSTNRQIGFGALGPIPWTAMDSYAERHGYAENEEWYDDFMHAMHVQDEVFLTGHQEQVRRERKLEEARAAHKAAAADGTRRPQLGR